MKNKKISMIVLSINLFAISYIFSAKEKEEQNIILRIEGRNKEENDYFNQYIKRRGLSLHYGAIDTKIVSQEQKKLFDMAQPVEGFGNPIITKEDLQKIQTNQDIILKGFNPKGFMVSYLSLALPRTSLSFRAEPGFKYIIRPKPCNKKENNQPIIQIQWTPEFKELDFDKLFADAENSFIDLLKNIDEVDNIVNSAYNQFFDANEALLKNLREKKLSPQEISNLLENDPTLQMYRQMENDAERFRRRYIARLPSLYCIEKLPI